MDLECLIQYLKGVGPKKAIVLQRLGIFTVKDLLWYFPRAYENRAFKKTINMLVDGEKETFDATVLQVLPDIRPRANLTISKVRIADETGEAYAVWYNSPFVKNSLKIGESFTFNGKVCNKFNQVQVNSPVFEKVDEEKNVNVGQVVPIYPLTEGITDNAFRKVVYTAIENIEGKIEDYISPKIRRKYNLCDINYAIKNIHFPESNEAVKLARRRLIFEELFIIQLGLLISKDDSKEKLDGIKMQSTEKYMNIFGELPFELTNAQKKVLEEIKTDLASGKVMNRLLQGDVGSGKTVIAMLILLLGIENGYQGVMMVPTEILAKQHLESLTALFNGKDISIKALTGSTKAKEKAKILEELRNGEINIIVGTHALIEETVEFKNLGIIVTDEQHRFGVRQRARLISKGNNPHILVMTATPIPRTLSLILYGDLDISVIDELPPGRKDVKTYSVTSSYISRMYGFIKEQITLGRQVYYVCPLVEESENIEAESVEEIFNKISSEFSEYNVAILHGKMTPKDKENVMNQFKNGNIKILISTTVIEVGVNVPNASIMVIQNSERFGLSQLHQLRGRVGRGGYQSYCILISDSRGKVAKSRHKVMCDTNNGFIISEKDLEIRGPGDFFGTRQHGIPQFRIANLFENSEELKLAQGCAIELLKEDKYLEKDESKNLKKNLINTFGENLHFITKN